jgi:hypothetical protein
MTKNVLMTPLNKRSSASCLEHDLLMCGVFDGGVHRLAQTLDDLGTRVTNISH